ncbi:SLBB domain-containing protein [Dapis sp. BLCC M126]|uniref:polysaccharide biosynthesis/export family protein n=1 Tax=Dapis sp. BLCC M126 TaxID=3400189 RepID=UPI003CF8A788
MRVSLIARLLLGLSYFNLFSLIKLNYILAQPVNQNNNSVLELVEIDSNLTKSAYRLGGGDIINIDILGVPDYSGDYQIPVDGVIDLPLVGSLYLKGLTITEAGDAISAKYANILKRSIVAVKLKASRPFNIWISGEVNQAGSYAVALKSGVGQSPGTQYPTLLQAIEQAKGITLAADIGQIKIRRPQRGNKEIIININLWEMLTSGNLPQDITLRDGDSIFIPSTQSIDLEETRQIATTVFAIPIDQPRNVTVVGEVERPGAYVVRGGDTGADFNVSGQPTLTRAIQLAGGIKPLADIRHIQLRRQTRAGAIQTVNIDLWELLQSGDINQDAILQQGDMIVIPTASDIDPAESPELAAASFAPDEIEVSVVGEVRRPGQVKVPPNTPLNQAILKAGGFNRSRAKRNSVELIRLNFNGTVSRQTIVVDFASGVNEKTNPMLRQNDVVVISRNGIAALSDTLNTTFEFGVSTLSVLRFFEVFGVF